MTTESEKRIADLKAELCAVATAEQKAVAKMMGRGIALCIAITMLACGILALMWAIQSG